MRWALAGGVAGLILVSGCFGMRDSGGGGEISRVCATEGRMVDRAASR